MMPLLPGVAAVHYLQCRRKLGSRCGCRLAMKGGNMCIVTTKVDAYCRAGYRAVLANAVRLAATTADTQELLRTVLSGPQPSPQQAQEQERTLPVESSGLQGYVMKPRYS